MNRLRNIIASLCLALASLAAQAAQVSLAGQATDYAGKIIVVKSVADYVSRLPVELASIEVQPDGSFNSSFEIAEVTYAHLDLGAYTAYIYLEPGAHYQVVLPPFRPRPDAERFNPFYRPTAVNLAIVSTDSNLNKAIRDFDNFFTPTLARHARELVRAHDRKLADKIILRADSAARAAKCDKPFFKNHVLYREAEAYAAPRLNAEREVVAKFFAQRPVAFNLPAYWNSLSMLSLDIFSDIRQTKTMKSILKEKNSHSPSIARLSAIVAADSLWASNANLREAVILKSLYDEYYQKAISEGLADTLLVSAAKECAAHRNRLIAANIYAKKNKLRPGLPAPELNLVSQDDKDVSLKAHNGKFVYIAFMHTENYECIKALAALENMAQLHKKEMDVICVFTNENPADAYDYMNHVQHTWQGVSFIANQKVIFDYEVAALPTYFLIAPDGTIAMAQAPGPTEKVGPAIAAAIRNYIIDKERGRPQIPRTIYDIANETR